MSYERPTFKDCERLLTSYAAMVDHAGMVRPGYKLVIEQGSKTYGRAYRLFETPISLADGSGYYKPMIGDDFLGMTAREAHDRLSDRLRVISDVLAALKGDQ